MEKNYNTNSFANCDTSQVLRLNVIFYKHSKTLFNNLLQKNQTKFCENISTVIIGVLDIQ